METVKEKIINSRKNQNALPYVTRRVYSDYKGIPFSAARIGSFIMENSPCKKTKRHIAAELSLSEATVYRAMNKLEKNNFISREKTELSATNVNKRKYIKHPKFLEKFVFEFDIYIKDIKKHIKRPLNNKELEVYAHIYSWTTSKNNTTGFYLTSISMLAKIIDCSERTVWTALRTLLKCNLINRTDDNKGTSNGHMSAYTLNKKTLRRISKILKKRNTDQPPTRQEVENYYRDLRDEAEGQAEENRAEALKDEQFKELDKERTKLERESAFASVKAERPGASAEDKQKAKKNAEDLERINKLIKERLDILGFDESDLEPKYYCKKCNDTGQDKYGNYCLCYFKRFSTKPTTK